MSTKPKRIWFAQAIMMVLIIFHVVQIFGYPFGEIKTIPDGHQFVLFYLPLIDLVYIVLGGNLICLLSENSCGKALKNHQLLLSLVMMGYVALPLGFWGLIRKNIDVNTYLSNLNYFYIADFPILICFFLILLTPKASAWMTKNSNS